MFAKAISKAFSALYVYDYFLTIGDEARLLHPCVTRFSECATDQACVEGPENMVFVGAIYFKVYQADEPSSVLDLRPRGSREKGPKCFLANASTVE